MQTISLYLVMSTGQCRSQNDGRRRVNKALDVKITDLKERYTSGVLKYRQMGYWEPDYEPKDTDVLAVFHAQGAEGVTDAGHLGVELGVG